MPYLSLSLSPDQDLAASQVRYQDVVARHASLLRHIETLAASDPALWDTAAALVDAQNEKLNQTISALSRVRQRETYSYTPAEQPDASP
jgi:hypothetical protein